MKTKKKNKFIKKFKIYTFIWPLDLVKDLAKLGYINLPIRCITIDFGIKIPYDLFIKHRNIFIKEFHAQL